MEKTLFALICFPILIQVLGPNGPRYRSMRDAARVSQYKSAVKRAEKEWEKEDRAKWKREHPHQMYPKDVNALQGIAILAAIFFCLWLVGLYCQLVTWITDWIKVSWGNVAYEIIGTIFVLPVIALFFLVWAFFKAGKS